MDRRSLIKRAGLAGVAATIAAPAVHAQATVRWRQKGVGMGLQFGVMGARETHALIQLLRTA